MLGTEQVGPRVVRWLLLSAWTASVPGELLSGFLERVGAELGETKALYDRDAGCSDRGLQPAE